MEGPKEVQGIWCDIEGCTTREPIEKTGGAERARDPLRESLAQGLLHLQG